MFPDNKKTILLVDDELFIAINVKTDLEKYGYNVLLANSGKEAIETFEKNPCIDLILMDINLGDGIDGTQAVAAILKKRDIPVVFLSSHAQAEVMNMADSITSYGYILKGSSYTVLVASIKMAFKLFEAHQKIIENEKRLHAVFNSTFQFIGLITVEGILIEANKTALDLAGIRHEDVAGKPFWDTHWWTGDEERVKKLKEALKDASGGKLVRYEDKIQGKGDDFFIIDFSLKPVIDDDGKVIILILEGRDITEYKKKQAELGESEEMFHSLLDNSINVIYRLNIQTGLYDYISPSAFRITGFSVDELLAQDASSSLAMIHPDDLPAVIAAFKKLEEDGTVEIEYRQRTKSGNYIWFSNHLSLIKDSSGSPLYRYGNLSDITNRKNTEAALKESERDFRHLFERHTAIQLMIDPATGNIFDANIAASNYYGWPREEMRKMNIMQISLISQEEIQNEMQKTKNTGKSHVERKHRRADGSVRDVEIFSNYIRMAGREYFYSIIFDITDRKSSEEKISKLLEEKELILREVHHRLKNNMNTINSLIILQTRSLKDASAIEALKDASSRIRSMILLYDKLYQYNRVNKNISIMHYLSILADEIIANFPNSNSVILEKKIDDFILDEKTLQAVGIIINELLTNIMKYAFTGKNRGLIKLSAVKRDNTVVISVADNGVGMPESVDLENPATFGLQMVLLLVKQIKGTVRIEKGEGTKITLEFKC
jgi:PAS domain S-box-containing protein